MLVYYDPFFLHHDTGRHPESTAKLLPSAERIANLDPEIFTRANWETVSFERLRLIHAPDYIEHVREIAESGGGQLDPDTIASKQSFEVARLAAGAVCDAVEQVSRGNDRHAFCLLRPPGHHALADRAMGFCLFNNVAVAARMACKELGYQRVLIIDWDVHHGNGTQDIFYDSDDVCFYSMHRRNFYPYTGEAAEIGAGKGKGWTRNVPVPFGTPRQSILDQFEESVSEFADQCKPELIIVSAGFDGHQDDPVGSLGMHTSDFAVMTKVVQKIAVRYANGKIVSVLEGGYNPPILADCVETHLLAFD